ncbi:MAG: polysaccharide deacetylase family protein [Pseudomonadales bacterium]
MSFLRFKANDAAKRLGRGFVSSMSELSGYSDRAFDKLASVPSWTILGYHRIIEDPTADPFDFGMCTSVENFESQLEFLKSKFRVETVQSALNMIQSGTKPEKPILSITFDDGYLDNHTLVLPMLEKAGVQASFYVCTSDLKARGPFWWDRVIFALAHTQERELSLEHFDLDTAISSVSLAPYRRRHSLSIILQALWSVDYPRCLDIVEQLEKVLQAKADHHWAPRMNAAAIRDLLDAEMEIGCHNSVHHDMTLMDVTDVEGQLKVSGDEISAITGRWPEGFAYPAGAQSEETRQCVLKAKYTYALGTDRGLNPLEYERFNLRRMSVGNNSISDFKRCLASLANSYLRESGQQSPDTHLLGYK